MPISPEVSRQPPPLAAPSLDEAGAELESWKVGELESWKVGELGGVESWNEGARYQVTGRQDKTLNKE